VGLAFPLNGQLRRDQPAKARRQANYFNSLWLSRNGTVVEFHYLIESSGKSPTIEENLCELSG
jgi:hypothetical protein